MYSREPLIFQIASFFSHDGFLGPYPAGGIILRSAEHDAVVQQAPGETAVAFTVPPTQAAYVINPSTGLVESVTSSSVDVAEPTMTTVLVPNVSRAFSSL